MHGAQIIDNSTLRLRGERVRKIRRARRAHAQRGAGVFDARARQRLYICCRQCHARVYAAADFAAAGIY